MTLTPARYSGVRVNFGRISYTFHLPCKKQIQKLQKVQKLQKLQKLQKVQKLQKLGKLQKLQKLKKSQKLQKLQKKNRIDNLYILPICFFTVHATRGKYGYFRHRRRCHQDGQTH